jgi:hypothetical protein
MIYLHRGWHFGLHYNLTVLNNIVGFSFDRLKIWWQSDQHSKFKVALDVGGGGVPDMGIGVGKTRKEVKADIVPESSRPNMITVPENDFIVKETNPDLGKAVDYKHQFDLVEQMTYLFVRVNKARDLMGKDENGSSDPVSDLFLSLLILNLC